MLNLGFIFVKLIVFNYLKKKKKKNNHSVSWISFLQAPSLFLLLNFQTRRRFRHSNYFFTLSKFNNLKLPRSYQIIFVFFYLDYILMHYLLVKFIIIFRPFTKKIKKIQNAGVNNQWWGHTPFNLYLHKENLKGVSILKRVAKGIHNIYYISIFLSTPTVHPHSYHRL